MRRARGMAVIMALLLVALAASAAALVLWQQSLWWQQLATERRRAEMRQLSDAGLALAIARLRPSTVVGPGQPWSRPGSLRENEGRVTVQLEDAQGRFNLNALSGGGALVDTGRLESLRRLLASLQLPEGLADALQRWRGLQSRAEQDAGSRPPAGHPALLRWDELAQVPGFTRERIARLVPYATVLPEGARMVNINTAPAQVLAALLPELPPGALAEALSERRQHPFRDVATFLARTGVNNPARLGDLTTGSDFFMLQAMVRHGAARRFTEALLKVEPGATRSLWRRDRAVVQGEENWDAR